MSDDRVTLRFLGSGDAFASGGRFQACILLEWRNYRALLDCGTSSLIAMRRSGVDPNSVDAILVTHLHGDHFGGIPFVLLDAYYGGRTKPLRIAGPVDLEERVRQASDAFFRAFAPRRLRYDLSYVVLPPAGPAAIGPLEVTAFPVEHVAEVSPHALRVRCGGRTLAYSGDATWSEGLVRAADGADLFICEASSFTTPNPAHVSYRDIIEHRAELACRRIVLTHLGQEVLDHLGEVELECAHDGMTLEL